MGMFDEWAKKYGESKIAGIDPSAPPQKFLGQILNNVVGDKPAEDGDGIRESASPIDFIAPEVAGALSGVTKKVSQVAMEAAPRILGNEVGAVGKDISGLQAAIKEAAARSNVKVVPTAEQAMNDAVQEQFKDAPKNFFDNARQKAGHSFAGSTPLEAVQLDRQREVTKAILKQRNEDQIAAARNPNFLKIKQALGNK